MKLTLEEKSRLIGLAEKASDLLVGIVEGALPKTKAPTENDIEFEKILSEIYKICPLLSDSYAQTYNYIQKHKISSKSSYVKQLKKQ